MKRTLSFADMTCLHKKTEKKVRKTQSCAAKFGSGMDDHHSILDIEIDEFDLCIDIECYQQSENAGCTVGVQRFTTKDLSELLSAMKTQESCPPLRTTISQVCCITSLK